MEQLRKAVLSGKMLTKAWSNLMLFASPRHFWPVYIYWLSLVYEALLREEFDPFIAFSPFTESYLDHGIFFTTFILWVCVLLGIFYCLNSYRKKAFIITAAWVIHFALMLMLTNSVYIYVDTIGWVYLHGK